jgi:hypothetical protein
MGNFGILGGSGTVNEIDCHFDPQKALLFGGTASYDLLCTESAHVFDLWTTLGSLKKKN